MSPNPYSAAFHRRQYIQTLLRDRKFRRLQDVAEALNREGYRVTISTVSRDLETLHIDKIRTPVGAYYGVKS